MMTTKRLFVLEAPGSKPVLTTTACPPPTTSGDLPLSSEVTYLVTITVFSFTYSINTLINTLYTPLSKTSGRPPLYHHRIPPPDTLWLPPNQIRETTVDVEAFRSNVDLVRFPTMPTPVDLRRCVLPSLTSAIVAVAVVQPPSPFLLHRRHLCCLLFYLLRQSESSTELLKPLLSSPLPHLGFTSAGKPCHTKFSRSSHCCLPSALVLVVLRFTTPIIFSKQLDFRISSSPTGVNREGEVFEDEDEVVEDLESIQLGNEMGRLKFRCRNVLKSNSFCLEDFKLKIALKLPAAEAANVAIQSIGCGYDISLDLRLKYRKGDYSSDNMDALCVFDLTLTMILAQKEIGTPQTFVYLMAIDHIISSAEKSNYMSAGKINGLIVFGDYMVLLLVLVPNILKLDSATLFHVGAVPGLKLDVPCSSDEDLGPAVLLENHIFWERVRRWTYEVG
ncbi:hypothetical protein LXL04_024440 [Taraxacum kok-saghyz]